MAHFTVIGLGAFGFNAAVALADEGHQVVALDIDRERVKMIKDKVSQAVVADATDRDALKALGIKDMDAVVVGLSEERPDLSILTTLYLKELDVPRIIVKVIDEDQAKIMEKVGATETIQPERDMAIKMAQRLGAANVFDRLPLSENMEIIEILVPEEFLNTPLRQLHLRAKYQTQVLLIKRGYLDAPATPEEHHQRKYRIKFPLADDTLQKGDILLLLGDKDGLKKIQSKSGKKI